MNGIMADELVSIIVPSYNAEHFIERCVRSILKQTYTNIELLLINDGSTDKTLEKCIALEEKDDRVRVIDQVNQGLSGARNTGIDAARGSYLLFIDADDLIEENAVEVLIATAKRTGASIVVSGVSMVDDSGVTVKKIVHEACVYSQSEFWQAAYRANGDEAILYIISCGKLFSSSLFECERFDLGKIHEDEFIIHRLVAQADCVSFIAEADYLYTSNETSITHTKSAISYFNIAEALCSRSDFFLLKGWSNLSVRCLATARYNLSKALAMSTEGDFENLKKDVFEKFRRACWANSNYRILDFADWCRSTFLLNYPNLYISLFKWLKRKG